MEIPELNLGNCPPFEVFYIISLRFCTESALRSASRISDVLEEYKEKEYDFAPQPFLDEAQNIANQGAAISRFFWPASKKYNLRGSILRNAFGIGDDNPLRDRTLRNMVEHFDEYLDDFLRNCSAGQFVPDYFGPKSSEERGPLKLFRAFFTNTGEFEILGKSYDLQPIIDEILRIHSKLEEAEKSGSRLPRNKIMNQHRENS